MTISVVSICNRALDLLGADPLTSLEDGTKTANLCLRNFAAIRDIVLRSYPWNSAMRRAGLAALADAPAWGYLFQYELPTGPAPERCLRVHRVARGENFRIEGRRILTDYPAPLQILYVAQIDDPADFDPLLAESIAARLSVYLAANLTESASRVDAMREYYLDTLALARSVDAQEGGADELDADVWLASRN
jgi:hypothetical protein